MSVVHSLLISDSASRLFSSLYLMEAWVSLPKVDALCHKYYERRHQSE